MMKSLTQQQFPLLSSSQKQHRNINECIRIILIVSVMIMIPTTTNNNNNNNNNMVDGRRLGTPIPIPSHSSVTSSKSTSSRSLWNSLRNSFTITTTQDAYSDLDQVHEYDDDDDAVIGEERSGDNNNNNISFNNNNQIIVRFDHTNDDNNGIIPPKKMTRDEIEIKAQQVAKYLGGTVIQIYEHIFYGATIGNIPSSSSSLTSTTTILQQQQEQDSTNTNPSSGGARTYISSNLESDIPSFTYETDARIGRKSIPTTTTNYSNDRVLQNDINNNNNVHVQSDAPDALDRINQKSLPLDQTYEYKYDGTGVTVFVVDSGIRSTHVDLQHTTIICGYSAFPDSGMGSIDGACDDESGHGTHVAGTIVSQTYGVAKGATVITVKVMDHNGHGSYTTLLSGIEYMIQYRNMYPTVPMVANLSLGSSYSTAINDAVSAAIQNNIIVVVAAGNQNMDACTTSPASIAQAITVGASRTSIPPPDTTTHSIMTRFYPFRRKERRTEYSNYGKCVDIFTWGSNVVSLGISHPTSTVTLSGTSMATPHVTGTVAMYLQRNPKLTVTEVRNLLLSDATTLQLQSLYQKRSPNRTLNTQNIV